jgi:folate-dependent phosphoribosylglycinamide formyltransferase PurN
MHQNKIVFLASDCESSRWVYNSLLQDYSIEAAIIEKPVSKKTLIKGRIKRIGLFKVMGQVFFSAFVVPVLKIKAGKRRAQLVNQYQLTDTNFIGNKTHYVESVNDDACKTLLQQLQPGIIIVNGTRIISKKILQSCKAVFINMHVGITPRYRGSHGGYWALYNNDPANFGTTIHLVDPGVDTGAVLKQVFTSPDKADNFTTYPILQVAIGIPALKEVIQLALQGDCHTKSHTEKGKLYHQPAIWEYFFNKTR